MRIAWLTQYDIYKLLPEIVINRKTTLHSSSWIHALSENLSSDEEVELHIITHTQLIDKSQHFKKNGIHFHIIKYSSPFTNRGFPWYFPFDKLTGYFSFSKNARKVIEQINPDVLHVHGTEGGYFGPARNSNIPCIISIQGIISEYIKIDPSLGNRLQLPYEQNAVKSAKFFGCRTNFDYDFVRKLNKEAIIYDLPEAMNKVFYDKQWQPSPELSILFVGSVNKRKGIVDLIYAMADLKKKFPAILLKIIGSGQIQYIDFLKKIIDEHGLSTNIRWLGNKAPAEVASELSKSTFFVLPTLMDNSPNCLAEAMAVGVPSIATRVGGIPSMIEDKIDGLLCEKNDVAGLVKIIEQLANDPELQVKISANAREKAFARNHPANVTKKYIAVYKSLIK